jgi:hypothetical protein
MVQRRVFAGDAEEAEQPFTAPLLVRWVLRVPGLNALPARLIAFGLRPEHVRMPRHLASRD